MQCQVDPLSPSWYRVLEVVSSKISVPLRGASQPDEDWLGAKLAQLPESPERLQAAASIVLRKCLYPEHVRSVLDHTSVSNVYRRRESSWGSNKVGSSLISNSGQLRNEMQPDRRGHGTSAPLLTFTIPRHRLPLVALNQTAQSYSRRARDWVANHVRRSRSLVLSRTAVE